MHSLIFALPPAPRDSFLHCLNFSSRPASAMHFLLHAFESSPPEIPRNSSSWTESAPRSSASSPRNSSMSSMAYSLRNSSVSSISPCSSSRPAPLHFFLQALSSALSSGVTDFFMHSLIFALPPAPRDSFLHCLNFSSRPASAMHFLLHAFESSPPEISRNSSSPSLASLARFSTASWMKSSCSDGCILIWIRPDTSEGLLLSAAIHSDSLNEQAESPRNAPEKKTTKSRVSITALWFAIA